MSNDSPPFDYIVRIPGSESVLFFIPHVGPGLSRSHLQTRLIEWLDNNIIGNWTWVYDHRMDEDHIYFNFTNKSDATLFKVTWG